MKPDLRQALRYALLSFVSLGAIGLGDVVLRYTYSLYLSFEPGSFLSEGWMLLAVAAAFAALGAWADRATGTPRWTARAARALLLALVFAALFQVFRQSLATTLPLPGWVKAAVLLGCALGAALVAWRAQASATERLGNAACLAMVTLFALQPGMLSYLTHALAPSAPPGSAAQAPAAPATRRSIVVVFDEWDMEVSEREGLFERDSMRTLLAHSFFAENALPAGSNTLESIPGMLLGQPFGEIDRGGRAWLSSKTGQEFRSTTPQLFSDLQTRRVGHAVVGYYHDYCALITTARSCHAEPVQFFQGWRAQFERPFKRTGQFDFPYSVFLRQWHATYARLHEQALRAVEDRANGVVWIHINVPHPPSALASHAPSNLREDYLANLQLTAELIEAIRLRLQAQGDPAALVLTSDHWLRERELWRSMYEQQRGPGSGQIGKTADLRVPLVVWFNDADAQPLRHRPAVSLLAMRELVLALTDGRLRSPQDLAAFFERQPPAQAPRLGGAGVH